VRPFVKEVLTAAAKKFEVIVFTASHAGYANLVLDQIDPDHSLIDHRLTRDNCIVVDNIFIKDLRVLVNRRLSDIIIIDN
jgi:CTD small phosphatase-like protein 2